MKWVGVLRRKGYRMDGFVLTEHRKFDFDKDYGALGSENGVLVLKGSELDTNCGHFLVYGITEELTSRIDFGDVHMDAVELVRERGGVRGYCSAGASGQIRNRVLRVCGRGCRVRGRASGGAAEREQQAG